MISYKQNLRIIDVFLARKSTLGDDQLYLPRRGQRHMGRWMVGQWGRPRSWLHGLRRQWHLGWNVEILAEPQSPRVGPMFFCWRKWCCSFKWTWKLRGFMSKLEMFRQIQQVLDSLNFYHDSFGWAFLVLGHHPHILQGGPPSDVNVGL